MSVSKLGGRHSVIWRVLLLYAFIDTLKSVSTLEKKETRGLVIRAHYVVDGERPSSGGF